MLNVYKVLELRHFKQKILLCTHGLVLNNKLGEQEQKVVMIKLRLSWGECSVGSGY